jgi:hypothetical protein
MNLRFRFNLFTLATMPRVQIHPYSIAFYANENMEAGRMRKRLKLMKKGGEKLMRSANEISRTCMIKLYLILPL